MIKTNWLEVQSLYVYAEGARAWTCFPVYAGLLSGMAFALAPSTIPFHNQMPVVCASPVQNA